MGTGGKMGSFVFSSVSQKTSGTNCIKILHAHYFICSTRFISMSLFVFY